jgi:uroporphyrinogen decarboxylase
MTDLAVAPAPHERSRRAAGQPGSERAVCAPDQIRAQVVRVLESYGHGHGHVFNLGHGIYPDVPLEHVQAMIEAVHELSPHYHQ